MTPDLYDQAAWIAERFDEFVTVGAVLAFTSGVVPEVRDARELVAILALMEHGSRHDPRAALDLIAGGDGTPPLAHYLALPPTPARRGRPAKSPIDLLRDQGLAARSRSLQAQGVLTTEFDEFAAKALGLTTTEQVRKARERYTDKGLSRAARMTSRLKRV